MKRSLFLVLLLLVVLAACSSQPEDEAPPYDIRGEWQYTLIDTNGNNYDDGTITFSGTPQAGSFVQVNFYAIEYEGQYQVSGTQVTLSGGEQWQATLVSAERLEGTWTALDSDAHGTLSAEKQ